MKTFRKLLSGLLMIILAPIWMTAILIECLILYYGGGLDNESSEKLVTVKLAIIIFSAIAG